MVSDVFGLVNVLPKRLNSTIKSYLWPFEEVWHLTGPYFTKSCNRNIPDNKNMVMSYPNRGKTVAVKASLDHGSRVLKYYAQQG